MDSTQVASLVRQLEENLASLPEPVARPVFIVVSGLPGTGKSYFSHKLAERIPLVILESDALRKAIYPEPAYSREESRILFQAIHLLIKKLLTNGISLVLDATNLSEHYREYLYNIAEHLDDKLILVYLEAPPDVVSARIRARHQDLGNRSDADWAVYQKMRHTVEKIRRKHFTVNTAYDITPALNKIVKEVLR
ncbi:MAG: ATP-binding protein [Chloroflexota bacterium]